MRLVLIILLVAFSNCINAQSLGSIITKAGGQLMQDLSNTDEWRTIGKAVETAGDMSYQMEKIKARNKEKIIIKTTSTKEKRLYPADGYKWKNRNNNSYEVEKVKNDDINRIKKSKRLLRKARKPFLKGDYNNALNLTNQSIEEEKTFLGYYLRAIIYFKKGYNEKALQDLGNSLNFKLTTEKTKWLYAMKGFIHAQMNDNKRAVSVFNKILKHFNYDGDVTSNLYSLRGMCKYSMNKLYSAKKDLNKSLKINPKMGGSFIMLGVIEMEKENYKKALNNLDKGIKIIKGNSEKMMQQKGLLSNAYLAKAKIYYSHYEDNNKALRSTNNALNINNKLPKAYLIRCKSKIKLGFKEGGCLDCSKAKKLGLVDKVNKNDLYTENCR